MRERTSPKREPKPCSLTSEWRRCVYEPGRCRKCIGAKIRAHIEKARTGRPLAEFPCPYFERAATLGQWPAPAGSDAESLERTAEKFAALLADAGAPLADIETALASIHSRE